MEDNKFGNRFVRFWANLVLSLHHTLQCDSSGLSIKAKGHGSYTLHNELRDERVLIPITLTLLSRGTFPDKFSPRPLVHKQSIQTYAKHWQCYLRLVEILFYPSYLQDIMFTAYPCLYLSLSYTICGVVL